MLTGAITPSAWASCPSQRKLSQKIKPDHSKPSMLLYRNINPALKCEAPQGPKPSDCLGRMAAGRAAAGQGKAGIVFSWARQLWNCSGSRTSLERRHLPTPTWIPGGDERTHRAGASAGNCIPGYPLFLWNCAGTESFPGRSPRIPHSGLSHGSSRAAAGTDTGPRLRLPPNPKRCNSWGPCGKPRGRGRDGNARTKQQERPGSDPAPRAYGSVRARGILGCTNNRGMNEIRLAESRAGSAWNQRELKEGEKVFPKFLYSCCRCVEIGVVFLPGFFFWEGARAGRS